MIPWSNDTVDPAAGYPHGVNGTVFEETAYGLVGIAGESRSGDANGQYIRVEAGGGTNTIVQPSFPGQTTDPATRGRPPRLPAAGRDAGARRLAEDAVQAGRRCETQDPPDLSAGGIFAGDADFPDTPVNPNTIQDLIDQLGMIPFPLSAKRFEGLQSDLADAAGDGRHGGRRRDRSIRSPTPSRKPARASTRARRRKPPTSSDWSWAADGTAIRKHLRDFIAIVVLIVIAGGDQPT